MKDSIEFLRMMYYKISFFNKEYVLFFNIHIW